MRKLFQAASRSALICAALTPAVSLGQTVNYGELEELLGEPITTSATGKPQKQSEVPANLEIITQDDIRRSGADNIPDVLQYLTGISFRRNGINEPDLSIRGFDEPWNPRLLVLINGQPVYEDFFGDVIWAALPVQLDEIRQIEVVKGPNAALFGFNAISGVINILTYDPMYDSVNGVTLRGGTQSLKEGSAVASYSKEDSYGIRLSAGGMQSDDYPIKTLPDVVRLPYYLQPSDSTGAVDARVRLSDKWVGSVNAYTATMHRNFFADGQIESDRTWSLRGQLAGTTPIGTTNLDAYWTGWHFDFPYLQDARSSTRDLRLSDLFKIGVDNTFRLSAEYKYNEATGQYDAGSKNFYNIYAFGVMWDWAINPKLEMSNAIREDYLTLGHHGGIIPYTTFTVKDFDNRVLNATSFNSGLVYHASPDDTLRLLVSRGFQLPSLDVLGMQLSLGGTTVFAGDPHVQATQVLHYEGDYDRDIAPLNATLRTAVFHQTNTNLFNFLVVVPRNQDPFDLTSTNTGNANETGAEILLKSKLGTPLRWSLGYSYATISDHIKSGLGTVLSEPFSAYHNGTPSSTVTGSIGYSWRNFEFDASGGWRSHFQDWQQYTTDFLFHPVTTKDYTTLDLHIGYKFTDNLRLGLTLDNAGQAFTHESQGSVAVQRRVFGSLTACY